MPANYNASNKVTVNYEELAYYPVTFSAGPNGTIKATTGSDSGTEIKSGTMVKEGTEVYFKATGNDNYVVSSWRGDTTTNSSGALNTNTQTTYLTVDGAKNVSAYFAYKNDGTQTSESIYIAIGNRDITGNNEFWHPDNWSTTRNKVYVKDGHAYWYINNPGTTKAYYFSLANEAWNDTSKNDAGRKLYHWDDNNLKVNNDFNQYLETKTGNWYVSAKYSTDTTVQNTHWKDDKGNEHQYFYGYVYAKESSVSRIIIDLGELSSDGKSVSGNYRVIPVYDTDATNVDIYAKDGTYRGDEWYDFFPGIADTTITGASNIKRHTNMSTGAATRGTTITVTTTIDGAYSSKYYVKGFSFNGTTPQLFDYSSDGVYTQTYKIPENFAYDYLEITPIYYQKDAKAVEFYIENYDDALQATGWGNTLSVYPYYFVSGKDDLNASDNAFGGYPGQPVIYYGGRRFIQIPTSYTMERAERGSDKNTNYPAVGATAIIKGITLSNDYWDIVHREYVHAVDQHLQTYDYDDFYKINKETSDGQEVNKATYTQRTGTADQITFAFKYRDQYDNFGTNRQTKGETIPSTITKSTYTNGWEPLLDYHDRPIDLFGKILTEEEQKKTPLLAVSNGYEYTHAGYYATTWTIYYKNGSTYSKIGTITPSALEISSKTRLDNRTLYPNSAGRGDGYPTMKQLGDYSSTYDTLKTTYANTPVEITYERVLSNYSGDYYTSWGEKSNRSDGRWYYSYYSDDVHANIRIEYKNDESESGWTVDPFKGTSNQGTVTGGKAYFTNADYEGKTETGNILSNPNSFYEFEATPAPGYVFAGWWFERDGIVTNVNEDLTKLNGKSQMTSNATFVARYIKNPSGTLTINHKLAEGSVGSGTTYVKLEAINKTDANDTHVITTGTDGFAELTGTIGSKYISYKSGYKFRVTLKTVTNDVFSQFDRFSADENSVDFFSTANMTSTGSETTDWFEIDVDDLFTINAQGFPEQTKDTLTYYSHLNQLNIHYKLIYQYESNIGEKSYYGLQSYTVEGIFTREEFSKYLTWDSTFKTSDDEIGWYKFNPKADEFMAIKSPHEANIRRDLKWDFTGGNLGTVSYFKKNTANGWNGEITVTKVARNDLKTTKNIQFIFPYRMKNTNNGTEAEKTNGKVVELTETDPRTSGGYSVYLTKYDASFGKPYSLSDSKEIYVTAEPTIYDANDNAKEKHFQYWSVLAVPSEIEGKEQETDKEADYELKEVARCYNLGFNFSVYQDYIVKPVYAEAATTKEHEDAATISFAENARNQWNDNGGGSNVKPSWKGFGDRIFSDFMVGFDRQDKTMLNTLTDNSVTVGLITERLDTINAANAGTEDAEKWKVQSEKFYEGLYADRDADKSEIEAYIRGRAADPSDNKPAYSGITKSNDTIVLADSGNYENSFIKMSELDNKNRIEFTKVVPNISQKDKTNTGRKDYVYRAYSYMIDWNANGTIKSIVISKPVYYTIYDIAMIENGKGISNYTVTYNG